MRNHEDEPTKIPCAECGEEFSIALTICGARPHCSKSCYDTWCQRRAHGWSNPNPNGQD